MNEKRPIITSSDYGKDEDSVQSLIKKLEAVEREMSAFQHTVGRLSNLSQSLIDRSHFDRKNIIQMQVRWKYLDIVGEFAIHFPLYYSLKYLFAERN